jgi:tungstate transport system substrate-binding protein
MTTSQLRGNSLRSRFILFASFLAAALAVPAMASASDVIVQGTTDVRDAGLLEEVIEPGFHAAFPQYEIKYVSVGTGQAIANVKAGQGDALMVHAPTQEKTLVEEGYSLEPRGRAVFYSDYVIPGPLDDPAEVLTKAPHKTALAYELIAKAGAEGKANFVSRGDKSGTNTQELLIWKLTGVELNELGEPGPAGTKADAAWYHKAGAGQGETVQVTNQCPEADFPGGNCYEMTDRGTFNRLASNGSVTQLKIVSDANEAAAPGGQNLLTNPFVVYAINPAKVSGVNLNTDGAKALLEYLSSDAFQTRLASYPNTAEPAFFADAHPKISAGPNLTGTYNAGAKLRVSGNVSNLLPGSPAIAGQPVQVQQFTTVNAGEAPGWVTVGLSLTQADGSYSIEAEARHSGDVRLDFPTSVTFPSLTVSPLIAVGALTQTDVPLGTVTLAPVAIGRARVALKRTSKRGRLVTLRGQVNASQHDAKAEVVVQGRKLGTKKKQKFHALKKVKAGTSGSYKISVKLTAGKWKLRVRYQDPGAVLPGTSRAVSVSVR